MGLAIEPWHPEPRSSQSRLQHSRVSEASWPVNRLLGDSMARWRGAPQCWCPLDQIKFHLSVFSVSRPLWILLFHVCTCVCLALSGFSCSSDGKPSPPTACVLTSQTHPRALRTDLKRGSFSFAFCFHQELPLPVFLGPLQCPDFITPCFSFSSSRHLWRKTWPWTPRTYVFSPRPQQEGTATGVFRKKHSTWGLKFASTWRRRERLRRNWRSWRLRWKKPGSPPCLTSGVSQLARRRWATSAKDPPCSIQGVRAAPGWSTA